MRQSYYIKSIIFGVILAFTPFTSINAQNIPQTKCLSAYGEIVCGIITPPNWLSSYSQNNNNTPISNDPIPPLYWSVYSHNLIRKDCSIHVYNAMNRLNLNNIKYKENINNKYDALTANWGSNVLSIACLNNTIMILWAGNNQENVSNLYNVLQKEIKQEMEMF